MFPSLRFQILLRAVFIVLAVVITWQSLLPAGDGGGLPHMDKLLHFLAYGGLAVLARLGWPDLRGWHLGVALIGLGVAIEIAQGLMGWGRTASLLDVLANLIGVLAGLSVGRRLLRSRS